ncbi:MAG: Crp/Fnr family transcriptional regulator [Methylococcales bacterium]
MSEPIADDKLEKWLQQYPFSQLLTITDKGVIYRQGDRCAEVFLLIKGVIKLDHVTPLGNTLTIALLHRGDLLGKLNAQNDAESMEDTAQAIGEVRLYRCNQGKFRELLSQKSDVAWQVFDRLSTRCRQAERKLRSALTQTVETRVIETLKDLSNTFGIRCTHGYALEIHLTQQELADLVGANRSVVSSIMNDLRNRNLLDYTRELICIHDTAFDDFYKQFV